MPLPSEGGGLTKSFLLIVSTVSGVKSDVIVLTFTLSLLSFELLIKTTSLLSISIPGK